MARPLPTGRFQLPTRHTPAPDLWITLPAGYQIKYVGRLPNDELFIIRNDDPSLRDSNAVSSGFLRFFAGVIPQTGLSDAAADTAEVRIAGQPLQWRLARETLPDGRTLYEREIRSGSFFRALKPSLANVPLHLHIFVAGTDSARVAELARAAGTIGTTP